MSRGAFSACAVVLSLVLAVPAASQEAPAASSQDPGADLNLMFGQMAKIPLSGVEGAPPSCPWTIQGTLGSGSPEWPSVSGNQVGRLNRNGIASTCAVPKTCNIFTATGDRAFDAYTFNNNSGLTACVNVQLDVITQTACNLQVNAYLDTYDPTSICTGYLADPGLSSGTPPSPIMFSTDVPAGGDLILVVHTTNPGEFGCVYDLTMSGDCVPVAGSPIITDGDANFERSGTTPFDGTPSANFTGVDGSLTNDHVFETGWWFRVAGDTQENPPGTPDSEMYSGDTSTIDWNAITTANLVAQEISVVTDGGVVADGSDGGWVKMDMTLTNNGGSPVTVDVFHYVDYDLDASASGDSATLFEFPATIQITDTSFAQYRGEGADAYQVTSFATLRNALNDSSITDLDNSGLPFGPGDFTGGMQWSSHVLAASGGSETFTAYLAVNQSLACGMPGVGLLCDGFESGDTSIWTTTVP